MIHCSAKFTRPALIRVFLGVVAALLAIAAQAADRPKTAEDWLEQLGPALNTTSYKGVFVYSRGDQVSSMRIAHRFRNGQVEERLLILDGDQGEIIRKGNRVFCVLPSHGRIQIDSMIPTGPFSDAFDDRMTAYRQWYAARMLHDDRVAGHEAVVVALNPKDVHRYRYRLWLEKQSGLLVKSQVLTNDNKILERFQFTMLELTDDIPDSEFRIPAHEASRQITLNEARPARHQPKARFVWKLGWRPEGFRSTPAPHAPGSQSVAFSDGLASFSVFVAPVGDMDMPTGVSRIGATTVFMRKLIAGDQRHLVTVVGEIPPATAMKVARSVIIQTPEQSASDDTM